MNKKIMPIVLTITMSFSGMNFVHASSEEIIIHVTTDGSDSAIGTSEEPLASLDGAKRRIQKIKKENPEAVISVVFHEGDYRFDKTVEFTDKDSGTEEKPITYRAAEGEKVNFKGSVPLDIGYLKPITDETIKKRLKSDAVDYVGELDLKKFGIEEIVEFRGNTWLDATQEYTGIYLNGKEQPIAQYPNGEANYAVWESVIDAGGKGGNSPSGGTIKVTDDAVTRWSNLDNFWLGGYFGVDYRYERINGKSVDCENKTITLANGADMTVKNPESKRWKAFNVLEELDAPGEWFIDQKNLMLYYWAPYNIKDATFEISMFSSSFITMAATENIVIDGINFSQSLADGIILNPNTKGITIKNCTFENIEKVAIKTTAKTSGTFEPYYNYLEYVSNLKVTDNLFYNIGSSAISSTGAGNRQTLSSGEIEISNNYIQAVSLNNKCIPAINLVGGIGTKITHNIIHSIPFHAINFHANETIMTYNDISNACMEVTDAGVLYTGNSYIRRGNEIAYNYIHNYKIKSEQLKLNQVAGVYFDDSVSGNSVHNNIFEAGGTGVIINKGSDTMVKSNIFADINRPLQNTAAGPYQTYYDNAIEALTYPGWAERYPSLVKQVEEPGWSLRNEIIGNITHNEMKFESIIADRNKVEDNIIYTEKDIYVDPENNDYRLKSDHEFSKQLPEVLSDDNFDINQIGFEEGHGIEIPKESFRKLYPQNGAYNIDVSNIEFKWEAAKGAEEYRLVVAKDPEFKDVVIDKKCYYNYTNVTELKSNQTSYYYTVFAKKTVGGIEEWESSNAKFRFTTSMYANLNKTDLVETVKYAEGIIPGMKEGNEAGKYKAGTIDRAKELLEKAKEILKWENEKDGLQQEVNAVNSELRAIFSEENINSGYVGIEDIINDFENWTVNSNGPEDTITSDGETLTISSQKGSHNVQYKETQFIMASRNTVSKFQMNCDLSKGWIGMGLRTVVHDYAPVLWAGTNPCYFFAIKKDVIEFQKVPGGIIKEIPNSFIKSEEWHEIEFGVLNSEICPVVVLYVDGVEVLKYDDTSLTQKFEEGAFSFYVGNDIRLRASREMDKEFPYDGLMKNVVTTDSPVLAFKENKKTIFAESEAIESEENTPIKREGMIYLPLRVIVENFGMTVSWKEEGYAEIIKGEEIIRVWPTRDKCYKNEEEIDMNVPINDNGYIKVEIQDITTLLGLESRAFSDGIYVIGKELDKKANLQEIVNKFKDKG